MVLIKSVQVLMKRSCNHLMYLHMVIIVWYLYKPKGIFLCLVESYSQLTQCPMITFQGLFVPPYCCTFPVALLMIFIIHYILLLWAWYFTACPGPHPHGMFSRHRHIHVVSHQWQGEFYVNSFKFYDEYNIMPCYIEGHVS